MYSNTGYKLLENMMQKIPGQPWHEFVRARILQPLDMNHTRLVRARESAPDVAKGYRWQKDKLTDGFPISQSILSYPGGGLVSTVRDLSKWDVAFYSERV